MSRELSSARLRLGAALAVAACMAGAGAGAAWADGSQPFHYTAGVQKFTVPADVYWVTIDAQGGHGGQFPNDNTAWGGQGGGVTATLATRPGQTYRVFVGGFGWYEGGWGYSGGGERGGASGAAAGYSGAGGGGDSAVIAETGDILILDAGGGGGAGGDRSEHSGDYGGRGGDGGHPPGDGGSTSYGDGGKGGDAGGPPGFGGEDVDDTYSGGAGGGGGGGFPNGGGGGRNGVNDALSEGSGGGGGGAGSSYIVAGLLDPRYYTSQRGCGWDYSGDCDGLITFSWGTTPHNVAPDAGSGQQRTIGQRYSPLRALVTNSDGVPVGDVAVRFTLPTAGASASFAHGATEATVRTDPNGIAVSPALTANGTAGRWTAEAAVADVPTPARFSLRNLAAATKVAATSSANPSVAGEPVHVLATVGSAAGDTSMRPVGKVQFSVDDDPVGDPVGLDAAGRATSPALQPDVGDHAVLAHFLGHPDYEASSTTVAQRVVKAPTSTAVSSSANPSGTGDFVSFSAHVTVPAPGAGVPGGSVRFQVDGSDLGDPVPIGADGRATSQVTSSLADGTRDVSAIYSGDASLEPSTGTLVQSVGPEATATVVSTSVDPAAYGEPITISAAVRRHEPGIDPDGRLSFKLDGRELCSASVVADGASCRVAEPPEPGDHAVRVDYQPGAGYEASHGTLTQRVTPARARMELSADPEPSALGDAIVLRAAMTAVAPGDGTPGGSVQFSVDGAPAGDPVAVHDGSAVSAPIATLPFGPHVIEADYADGASPGRHAPDHDATIHLVGMAKTITELTSSANPSPWGAPVTFTARVRSGAGAAVPGTVQFAVDGQPLGDPARLDAGQAVSPPVRGLTAGAHAVTAEYRGANGYAVSDAALTQRGGPPGSGPGGGPGDHRPGPAGATEPRLVIRDGRARVNAQGTLRLAVECVGAAGFRCRGELRLATAQPVAARLLGARERGRAAPGARIAVRRLSLAAGKTHKVRVDLDRAGERIMSRRAALKAEARVIGEHGTASGSRTLALRSARAPAIAIATRSARVDARGRVALRVRCAARRGDRCRGRVTLRARGHSKKSARSATLRGGGRRLARRAVSVAGARRSVVRLRLSAAARARLVRAGRLRARAVSKSTIRVGRSSERRRTIVLRAR